MLMPVMCGKCMEELIAGTPSIPADGIPMGTRVVPVQTVGLYRTLCSRGHNIVMIADFQQFELLFESGMEAYADTYFRESVSSFAAALERYYEFAIYTLLLVREIDIETIDTMWKLISAQSERQLGMFVGLYTSAFKKAPNLLSPKQVTFRNNVIHKGYFPSPDEALEFGKNVYDLLNFDIRELQGAFSEALQNAREIARRKAMSQLNPGENPAQFAMGTTISLSNLGEPPPILDAINSVIARLHRQRNPAVPSLNLAETRPDTKSRD